MLSYDGRDGLGNNFATSRPNIIAGYDITANQDRLHWFNPACFTLQAPGMLGNAGRNIGTSPSYTTLDINVSKDTKITERTFIQFRAELFTILNHTNFNYPTLSAFNGNPNPANGGLPGSPAPTAGLITSIIGTSRQIQFGLKLLF